MSLVVPLLSLLACVGPADETAVGVVFDDADGDGRRGADERGVAGVAVSNGRDVVVTDRDGRYALDVREHDVVFVTKPAGWAVPTDADNLPRFFHVHAPTGTPSELGLRYPGVEPSGPLPDSLDFALRRDPTERERFEAIWIADPQPRDDVELSHVRDAFVAELIDVDAEFGITVGDIMFDDLSLFPRSNALYGTIGVPWYHVPGNHEINFDAPDDRWSTETFKRHFGPTNYTHTAEHHELGPEHGFAGDDPLHLHILATVSGSWWSGPVDEGGIPTSWCRDGAPKGYYVMEVVGTAVSLRFVPLGMPADTQLRLSLATAAPRPTDGADAARWPTRLVEGRVPAARLATTELYANLFDGGPNSRVTLRVDGGEPRAMTRRHAPDPFFVDLYVAHEDEMKGWVEPAASTHLWVAPLPRDLPPGAHTLRVDAVDEYGAEHSARVVLEVLDG